MDLKGYLMICEKSVKRFKKKNSFTQTLSFKNIKTQKPKKRILEKIHILVRTLKFL